LRLGEVLGSLNVGTENAEKVSCEMDTTPSEAEMVLQVLELEECREIELCIVGDEPMDLIWGPAGRPRPPEPLAIRPGPRRGP
jgi:hypothetical protein